jgi:hypothetical protein
MLCVGPIAIWLTMNLISKFKGQTTPVCKFMGVFAPGRQVYGCPMYLTLRFYTDSSHFPNFCRLFSLKLLWNSAAPSGPWSSRNGNAVAGQGGKPASTAEPRHDQRRTNKQDTINAAAASVRENYTSMFAPWFFEPTTQHFSMPRGSTKAVTMLLYRVAPSPTKHQCGFVCLLDKATVVQRLIGGVNRTVWCHTDWHCTCTAPLS